jgi:hypothetical protein
MDCERAIRFSPGESSDDHEALVAPLHSDLEPVGAIEELLVASLRESGGWPESSALRRMYCSAHSIDRTEWMIVRS